MYSGLRYRLSLEFPAGYPYQPPRVKFLTSCFHPNVDNQGFICLDILKDKWSALYDVRSILLSIQSLLGGNQSTRSTPVHPVHPVHSTLLLPAGLEAWLSHQQRAALRSDCFKLLQPVPTHTVLSHISALSL